MDRAVNKMVSESNESIMSVKERIVRVHTAVFIGKDMSLLDRYWQEPYLQHNPTLPSGIDALRQLLPHILPQLQLTILRVLQDGDIIAFHQSATLGDERIASFDLYRVSGEKIVEHWDAMQPDPGVTPSGRTMFDGATRISAPHLTEVNRRLISNLVESVLIARDTKGAAALVAADIAQHSLRMTDGLDAFLASLDLSQPGQIRYVALRRVVAEGNFVLTVSEAESADRQLIVYDLWRIENSKVVEHWEAIQEVPPSTASGLPMF